MESEVSRDQCHLNICSPHPCLPKAATQCDEVMGIGVAAAEVGDVGDVQIGEPKVDETLQVWMLMCMIRY